MFGNPTSKIGIEIWAKILTEYQIRNILTISTKKLKNELTKPTLSYFSSREVFPQPLTLFLHVIFLFLVSFIKFKYSKEEKNRKKKSSIIKGKKSCKTIILQHPVAICHVNDFFLKKIKEFSIVSTDQHN